MLPNTEQYVNHSEVCGVPLKYMGKLTNGMNLNEDVHLNPDFTLGFTSAIFSWERLQSQAAASLQFLWLLKPDPESRVYISEVD